ncbi:MAG: ATP-binding protein [Oscillospiraceae bacterium]
MRVPAELCRQEQKKELTTLLGTGRERFEQFRLDYYPDTPDPNYGISPRQTMRLVLQKCQRYAREFTPNASSLLFTGETGLGKTFLSGCIARAVADGGYSVVYDTAIHLLADYEAAKFGENTEENRSRTGKYTACDLLIIDDLGTEMVTQFTVSALYSVINDRLMAHKPVILSTNLSPEELRTRYSAQIASRILGTYQVLQFLGNDIRMKTQERRPFS